MSKPIDLFYSSKPELTTDDWDQIVHSIITYGDKIWLKSGIKFSPRIDQKILRDMEITYQELKDENIIVTWDFEISKSFQHDNSKLSKVITHNEHKELYNAINETIAHNVTGKNDFSLGGDTKIVTKFIEVRQELWNIGLASCCEATGIINRSTIVTNMLASDLFSYELGINKYTNYLFKQFRIPSLCGLSTKAILELRKQSQYLRKKVDSLTKNRLLEYGMQNREILKDCNELYSNYLDGVKSLMKEKNQNGVFKELIINVSGLFVPIIGFLPLSKKLVDWLKDKNHTGFIMYMLHLQQEVSKTHHEEND